MEKEYKYIDYNDYINLKILNAVIKSRTRTKSYAKPSWWNDETLWLDCISTALSNYTSNPVTGNMTFMKNHKKLGWRMLEPDEEFLIGDLRQYPYSDGDPSHAVIITDKDENGNPILSYSNGMGEYRQAVPAVDYYESPYELNWIKENNLPIRTYRYVGTEADRKFVEDNNNKWMAQEKAKPKMSYLQPTQSIFVTKQINPENFNNKRKLMELYLQSLK